MARAAAQAPDTSNRNGFFYVFDRTDGKLLLAKSFVKKITWAKESVPRAAVLLPRSGPVTVMPRSRWHELRPMNDSFQSG